MALEVILKTCRSTENPPKPKTNEAIINLKEKLTELRFAIKESPLVTSINPVSKLKLSTSGMPKKAKTWEETICKNWLVLSIEIIIEKRTTKPPIISIVFIELIILLDKTSPKLVKDREELLEIEYSESL